MKLDTQKEDLVALLTDKQRDALNLLIQHKTSKEISRILRISPHTVDQRIQAAKRKFGVATRGDLAQAYHRSLPIGQQVTYENSCIAEPLIFADSSASDEPEYLTTMLDPKWSGQHVSEDSSRRYQVLPELFSGRSGTFYRLVAIFGMAALLVVTVMGGISIFVAMTDMLAH